MVAQSPNLIQIKRSASASTPASLANGELGWSATSNTLFIGNFGLVTPIAGGRSPGVLTANQALVANSTSFIDKIKVANATIFSITANNSLGSDGSVLSVNASGELYWNSTAAAGPAFVQNTDSRTLSGNLSFTGSTTTVSNLVVTTINRSPKLTLSGDASGNVTFNNLGDATLNVTIENNSIALGTDTTGDYVSTVTAGGGITITGGTGETSTPTFSANVDNSTIEVSGGALQVKDNGIALGTKTTGNYVAEITAGNGITGSASTEGATPTIAVQAGTGIVSNSTGVHVNSSLTHLSTVTVSGVTTLNGNTVLGDASSDELTVGGRFVSALVPSTNNSRDLGTAALSWDTVYARDVSVGNVHLTSDGSTITLQGGLAVNTNITANTGTFYHDLSVGGDLFVTGNVYYANVTNYAVEDSFIQLAVNNTVSDVLDIGFYGNYNGDGGAHEHTGLFRDASDGIYKLFFGLQTAPTTVVDTGAGTYQQGTLKAYLDSGALISNSTVLNITGTNSLTVALQANSLTLSTALATTSGGTGFNTYTAGDLLTGSGSTLAKLAIGTQGQVLQVASGGGSLIYGGLDGGTF